MKIYTEEYYQSFPDQLLSRKLLSFGHYLKKENSFEGNVQAFIADKLYSEPQKKLSYYQGSMTNEAFQNFLRTDLTRLNSIKKEIDGVINFIMEWADQQDLKHIDSAQQEIKVSESWGFFLSRLRDNYYSDKTKIFFSDGKKIIETLYFYLEDASIDIHMRKTQLISIVLDEGLLHCADGCYSRLQSACENLKNFKEKFSFDIIIKKFIFELSETIARKTPFAFLGKNYIEQLCADRAVFMDDYEIHAFNALQAYLFSDLQIPEFTVQDDYINFLNGADPNIFKAYVQNFKKNFKVHLLIKHIADLFYNQHHISFPEVDITQDASSLLPSEIIDESLDPFLQGLGSDNQFARHEILEMSEEGIFFKNKWALEITLLERLINNKWIDFSEGSRVMQRLSHLKHYLRTPIKYREEINQRIVPNNLALSWLKNDEVRIKLEDSLEQTGFDALKNQLTNARPMVTNINDLILFLEALPGQQSSSLMQNYKDALQWITRDYSLFELFFIIGDEPLLSFDELNQPFAELNAENLDNKIKKLFNLLDESSRKFFCEILDTNNPILHTFDIEELTQRIVYTIPTILLEKGIKTFKGNAIPYLLLRQGIKIYNDVMFQDAIIMAQVNECSFNQAKLTRIFFKNGIINSKFTKVNYALGDFGKMLVEGSFLRNVFKESYFNLKVENLHECQFLDSVGYPSIQVSQTTTQTRFVNFDGSYLNLGEIELCQFENVNSNIHAKNIVSSFFSDCSINIKVPNIIDTVFQNFKPSKLYISNFVRGGKFEKCNDLIVVSKDLVDVTFIEGKPKKIHLGFTNSNTDTHLQQMNSRVDDCVFSNLIIVETEDPLGSNLFFEKNTIIHNTYFKYMDFQEAFLSGFFLFDESYQQPNKLYFENSKFSSQSLSRFLTHASIAQFKNSNLNFFFLEGTDLSQIDFQLPDLKSTLLNFKMSFKKTHLINADFKDYSSLSHWDFTEANLQQAEFGALDLTGIKFINADLTGCDLSQALTLNADFTHAKIDSIKLNTQQLFQFYQQGHRDFSSLQLTLVENFALTDRHLQGCKLSSQAFDKLIQQGFKNFQAVDLSEVAHDVLEKYIHLDAYNFVAAELPTLLSHCSSPKQKQSRMERKKRAISDTCLFNENDLDEIKNELEEIDATKLKRLLETEPVEKGQQIIDYLTEKSLPIKGENNPRIQKLYDNLYLLNNAQQFFNKLNFGLIGMDAVAGIITGDVNKTFISLGMLGGNEVLGRISRFAAANQQAVWGRALSKLEPLSGQILTFVVLYNIIEESAAYKKGNKEILGNIIGDSLFVTFNLNSAATNFMAKRWMTRALSMQKQLSPVIQENPQVVEDSVLQEVGDETLGEFAAEDLEVNMAAGVENVNLAGETLEGAEALGLEEDAAVDLAEGMVATGLEETAIGIEGGSTAAGFLGAAAIAGVLAEVTAGLGFAAFVGTRIYSAAIKVKHINDRLPLTGNEKLCEGINAFLGFDLFSDAAIQAELEFQKKLELQLKKYTTKLIDIPEISHVFIPFIANGAMNLMFMVNDINLAQLEDYSSLDDVSFDYSDDLVHSNFKLGGSGSKCVSVEDYLSQHNIPYKFYLEDLDERQFEIIRYTRSCIYEIENNNIFLDKFYRSGLTWDRDRPIDVQDELVCFPNSTQSTAISGHGYLCEGAMGARLNNNEYPHALIVLNSGNDIAEGFPNSSNTFTFNEGHKQLEGGSKGDIFIAKGNVISGSIDGKGGINTLHLEQFYLKDKVLDIDLLKHDLIHADYQRKVFKIFNIQKLITRRRRPDRITVDCTTQYINGQAGKNTLRDFIDIPDLDCQPPIKLKIIMATDTYVKNKAHLGHFSYLFHRDKGESTIDIMGHSQNTTHEFLFNYSLSEVGEIKFHSAAINTTKLTIHFFNQHFYNISLTIPDQQTTVLQLNDKTEIHVRKNMTMTLHHTHLSSISKTITDFIPKTRSLQSLFIIQNPMNETITLGHPEYFNLLTNNPHFCNHLLGNGIENIYRITANLEASSETISHPVYQIAPNVTLYQLNKNQTRDSLDLISLHKQLKKQLNCTSQLAIQQNQTDLDLQIDCTSNKMLHEMHILLKDALDWYQKIEIYQELYPLVIVKNPEIAASWKLVPKPIVIPENKTQIVLLANRVQAYSSFILAKKAMNNLKFLYENRDNPNNLLITNYSPELTEDQLFFISVKKFFHNPIWKTITLQGNDFTIHLSEVSSVNITGALADLKPSLNFLTTNHTVQHQELIDEHPAAQKRSLHSAVMNEPSYLTSSANQPVAWLNSIFSYSKGLLSSLTDIVKPRVSDSLKANLSVRGDAPACLDIFNNDITPVSSDANRYSQTKNLSTVHSFQFFKTNTTISTPNLDENLLLAQVFLSKFSNKRSKRMDYQASTYNPTSFVNQQYINECESIVKNSIAHCEQKFK